MRFFTSTYGRSGWGTYILLLWLGLSTGGLLRAQMVTNSAAPIPDPTSLETPGETARLSSGNSASTSGAPAALTAPPAPAPVSAPISVPVAPAPAPTLSLVPSPAPATDLAPGVAPRDADMALLAALLTAASLAGFLLYHGGLGQAKNCAHTCVLLLLGTLFALAAYWIGGFALQTGGVGDAHAALAQPLAPGEQGALDHELGFMAGGHHWGLAGSSGFFLMSDESARNGVATLFLAQAALLVLAVAAALGAALERGRLLALSVTAFLIGVVIFPLYANWVWGGGWLAALGREFGLGHGVVDLAGAGVVHEMAGVLALVIALSLGPRAGRFPRTVSPSHPGHNVPFIVLGAVVLLISWMGTNAFAYTGTAADGDGSAGGVAAVNVLLGAVGGALATVIVSAWRKLPNTPVRLVRGLLGGAVALSGGSAFFDAWAALLVGAAAGLLVERSVLWLERRRIDDPSGATAVHGAAGAWGMLATGLFANGLAGRGINGVDGPVRGLFFGGSWHQLAAQAAGVVAGLGVAFGLGYACVHLGQKILGNRVSAADETQGLDWPQVGALGYQPDFDIEKTSNSD